MYVGSCRRSAAVLRAVTWRSVFVVGRIGMFVVRSIVVYVPSAAVVGLGLGWPMPIYIMHITPVWGIEGVSTHVPWVC